MRTKFKAAFTAMAEEIDRHPELEVIDFTLKDPATPEQLAKANERFNLTPAMSRFYEETNGLVLQWKHKTQEEDERGLVRGSIDLVPVEQVFGSWDGVIHFDFYEDNGEEDPFRFLHPLDFFEAEACAALNLDGSKNPSISYHYCGEEEVDMGVDFEAYLELLMKSRGYWYWQKSFVEDEQHSTREETIVPPMFRSP